MEITEISQILKGVRNEAGKGGNQRRVLENGESLNGAGTSAVTIVRTRDGRKGRAEGYRGSMCQSSL